MPGAIRDELRAGPSVLEQRRRGRMTASAEKTAVFRFVQEDEVGAIADLPAGARFRRHEGLEHVDRDLRPAAPVAEEFQPRQLLPRWRGPQMHVPRPEIRCRERAENRLGRDAQVGAERPAAVTELVDEERGRGTGPDGYPLHIDEEMPEAGQVEVFAHLRHQADTAVKQCGSGEGRHEAGSAGVGDGAAWRPVGSGADVANQDQVDPRSGPFPWAGCSRTLLPMPHVIRYLTRGQ